MTRALLALLLVAIPILSAGQSDARIVKPEIRVGDSWTYRSTNVLEPGTYEQETRVSFINDKVILLVSTRKSDGKEFDSSWTTDWNPVSSYTGFTYRPHGLVFRFPMHVGDAYGWKYEILRPRANTVVNVTTGKAKVVGWDTVEVPAGKFRAIKVELENIVQPSDGSRLFEWQATFWYVPDVRRWVKFVSTPPGRTISEELLSYRLNED